MLDPACPMTVLQQLAPGPISECPVARLHGETVGILQPRDKDFRRDVHAWIVTERKLEGAVSNVETRGALPPELMSAGSRCWSRLKMDNSSPFHRSPHALVLSAQ